MGYLLEQTRGHGEATEQVLFSKIGGPGKRYYVQSTRTELRHSDPKVTGSAIRLRAYRCPSRAFDMALSLSLPEKLLSEGGLAFLSSGDP